MINIELKNSEWLRGTGDGALLCSTAMEEGRPCRCCLGVLDKRFSVKDDMMEDTADFSGYSFRDTHLIQVMPWLRIDRYNLNSDDTNFLISINDDPKISNDYERIKKLNEIVNKHEINFVFREEL